MYEGRVCINAYMNVTYMWMQDICGRNMYVHTQIDVYMYICICIKCVHIHIYMRINIDREGC